MFLMQWYQANTLVQYQRERCSTTEKGAVPNKRVQYHEIAFLQNVLDRSMLLKKMLSVLLCFVDCYFCEGHGHDDSQGLKK